MIPLKLDVKRFNDDSSKRNNKSVASLNEIDQSNFTFNILFNPQYQDYRGQVICYPGSVFEGIVQIKVLKPTPVHHIKLVFKASEKVHNFADRLFAIRTVLWGLPANTKVPNDTLPILKAGEYKFPFICQLPVINFPPTFQHRWIAINYSMVVCVDKGNSSSSIVSKSYPVEFQPFIETMPRKSLVTLKEEATLTNNITVQVKVPQPIFNIQDYLKSIPVNIKFLITNAHSKQQISLAHLCVCIKRYYFIRHTTFKKKEEAIIAQQNLSKLPSTCPCTVTMNINLPENKDDLPPTITYSQFLSIKYKLVISFKVRHGPLIKNKNLEFPILLGTLPVGTSAPRQLEPYTDVTDNGSDTLDSVPQFIKPELNQFDQEEILPAYDCDITPPSYDNSIIPIPVL